MEFLDRIEQLAGIKMEKLGIPSDDEMAKAKNKDIIKKLKDVDESVVKDF
jgi:hypothetical protein